MRCAIIPSLLVVLAHATPAFAQSLTDAPSELQLAWSAPGECPDHDAVVARVERLLARELQHGRDGLSVAARVTRASRWRLQLAIVSSAGETTRTLEADDCEHLADATALMLALAIDPDAIASSSPAPTASSSPPPAASEPPASPEPPSPPPPSRPSSPSPSSASPEVPREIPHPAPRTSARTFDIGIGLLTDVGILPLGGIGFEARLGLSNGSFRIALRTDYWPNRTAVPETFNVPPASIQLVTVGAEMCYAPTWRHFELRTCGALDAGAMIGSSGWTGSGPWVAMFSEASVGWRPARAFVMRLQGGPGVTLAWPQFVQVGSSQVLYQPSPVAGRAALIVELSL